MSCIRPVNRLSQIVRCPLAVLIRGPTNRIASIRRPVSHVMAFHRNGLSSGKLPRRHHSRSNRLQFRINQRPKSSVWSRRISASRKQR